MRHGKLVECSTGTSTMRVVKTAEIQFGRKLQKGKAHVAGGHFNPIQARGHFVPPHLNHSISSKRLGVWSYCFVTFFFVFSIRKSSVPPISPHVCCHGNHTTFWLIFENSNLQCFSSISTREKLSLGKPSMLWTS